MIAFFYSGGIALTGLFVAAAGVAGVLLSRKWQVPTALVYLLPGAAVWFGLLQAGIHPTLAGVILGLLTPVAAASRMEAALHPWVAYGVMPVFALANAGVSFDGIDFDGAASFTLTAGIVLGLAVGKPLGIVLGGVLAVRAGWCSLPEGVRWTGIWTIGCLGGIGFTMSIFIATLAFTDAALLSGAKLAVLAASGLAAAAGLIAGRLFLPGKS